MGSCAPASFKEAEIAYKLVFNLYAISASLNDAGAHDPIHSARRIKPMLDVNAYLDRIGYTGSTTPTPETLRKIHRAHMLSVPFENLDIGRRRIVLDRDSLIRKI